MSAKKPVKPYRNLSPADFINIFLNNAGQHLLYKSTGVQVYDYQEVYQVMKVPTTLFRPTYNYALLLREGHIQMQFGTDSQMITSPAALFISAGQLLSVQEISENIEGTLVILEQESLNRVFSQTELLKILHTPPLIPLSDADNQMVNDIARILLIEYRSEKADLQVLIALVQALLYKLLKKAGVTENLPKSQLIALKFKDLVYKHYVTEKNVLYYTRALNVTENYLNRCTQQFYGKTAKRYILEVAITQSQLLLQDMQKGIADVAYELNFGDSSYFTRIFRKITGITPTAYKRQLI